MSNSVLGFCAIPALYDNTKLTTSPIGELSNFSASFSKDIQLYNKSAYPGVGSLIFTSEIGNVTATLPDTLADGILKLSAWLYNQAVAGNLTNSQATCLQQLKAEFDPTWTNLSVGPMETNGKIYLPTWFSGNLKTNAAVAVKIWFADGAFRVQYPRREINVVGPVPSDEIDILFSNYKVFRERLALETPDKVIARINEIKKQYPESQLKVYGFNVVDTVNTPNVTMAYWTLVIYGPEGGDEDEELEAMRQDILSHSSHSRAEWEDRVPDLFNPLEFYLLPHWLELGLPNKTGEEAQYSPVTDYQTILNLPKKVFTKFTQDHIIKSLQVFPAMYKSVKVLALGKPTNRNGILKLRDLYPDYSLIPSTDGQFDEMSKKTTDFIYGLEELLIAAESMTGDSEMPLGVGRTVRDGILYAAKTVNGMKFLAVAKSYVASLN